MIDEELLRKWKREDAERSHVLLAAEKERTGIEVGTLVRRKSGKQNTGTVVKMWAYDGIVKAEVHWTKATRRYNGNRDMHSTIRLTSLAKETRA